MAFREDESRIRTGHAAHNMSILRRRETTAQGGIAAKRKQSGWNDSHQSQGAVKLECDCPAQQGRHGIQGLRHLVQCQAGLLFWCQPALQAGRSAWVMHKSVTMLALPATALVVAQTKQLLALPGQVSIVQLSKPVPGEP